MSSNCEPIHIHKTKAKYPTTITLYSPPSILLIPYIHIYTAFPTSTDAAAVVSTASPTAYGFTGLHALTSSGRGIATESTTFCTSEYAADVAQ